MNDLLLLLFLLSMVALIIGVIKPNLVIRWGEVEKRNRKKVLKTYSISMVIFFILFGMTIPPADSTETLKTEDNKVQEERKEIEKKKVKLSKSDKKLLKENYINFSEKQILQFEDIKEKYEEYDEELKLEIDRLNLERIVEEDKKEESARAKEIKESEKIKETEKEVEELKKTKELIVESNINMKSEILDVNYLLMWNNYDDEIYKDKYMRIAGKVHYIGKNHVNIKEGLEGITGSIYLTFEDNNISQLDSISEGDYIIITGKNTGKTAGQISVKDSNIETVGEEALKQTNEYKKIADGVFEQERVEAEKFEKEQMTEYKTKAKSISYENLIRNPHEYKGEIIKVSMKVSQIMGGGILTKAGYAGKQGDNEWFINYDLPEHSARILEGDNISFYGEFDDVVKMKRALTRTEVYIPQLNAKYFEFK